LKAGAWLRRVRFVIVSPDLRHNRRFQAEIPLIPVSEFGQPPLSTSNQTQESERVRDISEINSPK
jgi:hypothetical protein